MGQVLVDSNSLTAIAEAIRSKNKKVIKYKPNEMAGAIKALALDNSVVIQSNDAWKYAIDPTLEHQSITVKVYGKLTGDNSTGYKGEVIFEPSIKSNFGYIAGKIKKTVDSTNHIINFSAGPVTETDKLIQDGWTPVYVIGDEHGYYTTTTPDDENSFKPISSSDNIENILICGYYKRDSSTGKLSSTDPIQRYVGSELLSNHTKKLKNTYATSIGSNEFYGYDSLTSIDLSNATSIGGSTFGRCVSLTSVNVSNATSIGSDAFYDCESLTSIDLSKATSIGSYAFYDCYSLTSIDLSKATSIGSYAFDERISKLKYIVIDSDTVSTAHIQLWSGVKVLVPQSMMDAYSSDSYWSSYKSQLDAIKNYTITRENGQITVVPLKPPASYSSTGPLTLF